VTLSKKLLLGICLLLPVSFQPAKATWIEDNLPVVVFGSIAALIVIPVAGFAGYYWYKQHKLAKRTNQEVLSQATQFFGEVSTGAKPYIQLLEQIKPELKALEKMALEQEILKKAMTANSDRYVLLTFERLWRKNISELMQHNRWLQERIGRLKSLANSDLLREENFSFIKEAEIFIKKVEDFAPHLSSVCDIVTGSAQYLHEKHMQEIERVASTARPMYIYY
jgi:hypothetical protein